MILVSCAQALYYRPSSAQFPATSISARQHQRRISVTQQSITTVHDRQWGRDSDENSATTPLHVNGEWGQRQTVRDYSGAQKWPHCTPGCSNIIRDFCHQPVACFFSGLTLSGKSCWSVRREGGRVHWRANLPTVIGMSYDYYGFPLDLIGPNAAATGAARQRCEARESQQHPKWQRLADKGLLPGDDALKKLIRKVWAAHWYPGKGGGPGSRCHEHSQRLTRGRPHATGSAGGVPATGLDCDLQGRGAAGCVATKLLRIHGERFAPETRCDDDCCACRQILRWDDVSAVFLMPIQ